MKKKALLLILLVAVAIALQRSSPLATVFSEDPKATARWEVASPNYHLGELITATLRVTTQPGVMVDWSRLPDVDETLALPSKIVVPESTSPYREYVWNEVAEGELEVVSRRITQYQEGGLVTTEISYEFQYLLPIDFSSTPDDKRLPQVAIKQSYLIVITAGNIIQRTDTILAEGTIFYIVPRVDENSRPVFRQFSLTPPATHWPYVRLTGFGLIVSAFCLLAWRGASFVAARRRRGQVEIQNVPEVSALYQLWRENQDRGLFIEAIKLYRRGVWGRPSAAAWIKTTFILYSGVKLGRDQVEPIFGELVKEVSRGHSS